MDLITIYFSLATLLLIQQRSTKKKEKQGKIAFWLSFILVNTIFNSLNCKEQFPYEDHRQVIMKPLSFRKPCDRLSVIQQKARGNYLANHDRF